MITPTTQTTPTPTDFLEAVHQLCMAAGGAGRGVPAMDLYLTWCQRDPTEEEKEDHWKCWMELQAQISHFEGQTKTILLNQEVSFSKRAAAVANDKLIDARMRLMDMESRVDELQEQVYRYEEDSDDEDSDEEDSDDEDIVQVQRELLEQMGCAAHNDFGFFDTFETEDPTLRKFADQVRRKIQDNKNIRENYNLLKIKFQALEGKTGCLEAKLAATEGELRQQRQETHMAQKTKERLEKKAARLEYQLGKVSTDREEWQKQLIDDLAKMVDDHAGDHHEMIGLRTLANGNGRVVMKGSPADPVESIRLRQMCTDLKKQLDKAHMDLKAARQDSTDLASARKAHEKTTAKLETLKEELKKVQAKNGRQKESYRLLEKKCAKAALDQNVSRSKIYDLKKQLSESQETLTEFANANESMMDELAGKNADIEQLHIRMFYLESLNNKLGGDEEAGWELVPRK